MKLYSNEIVFRGHPDKVCDQISDALLDAYLSQDKNSRCGIETVGGKGKVFITGEVTSKAQVDVEAVAKRVLKNVGYDVNNFGKEYEIINNIGLQSEDIALGTNDDVGGAGDQGMMFGYACNQTSEMLPTAMVILQQFSKQYDDLRQRDSRFLSDGKAQITGIYNDNMELVAIKDFTISYQNIEKDRAVTDIILQKMALDICEIYGITVDRFLINPTGKFLIGGFDGDAGLTGRKIVVDTYHSFAPVGGGAFSGKDPTKVDRSGAYMARHMAKEILQKNNLRWVQVQLSYAIGIDKPLAIYIDTNKGSVTDELNKEQFEIMYEQCTPKNIIKNLNLQNICYEELARFGHFTK